MAANTALREAVLAAVRPYVGTYKSAAGIDKGMAFWPPSPTSALEPPAGDTATGLEVVVRLWPEDYDDSSEFTDTGVTGVLHYPVTLRAWQGTTWEAREALVEAFPLLTTRLARRARFVPGNADFVETLTLFIPIQT